MEKEEVWNSVVGFEGLYEISNFGRLISLPRRVNQRNGKSYLTKQRIMKGGLVGNGYLAAIMSKNGVHSSKYFHVMVLEAFIGPRPQSHDGCHNDGNKLNNSLSNLRWDTRRANHADKDAHGTSNKGERHAGAKLEEIDVLKMREMREAGSSFASIAKKFNVATMTAHRAISGKNWSHIK